MSHSFSKILLIRAPNNKIENDREMERKRENSSRIKLPIPKTKSR